MHPGEKGDHDTDGDAVRQPVTTSTPGGGALREQLLGCCSDRSVPLAGVTVRQPTSMSSLGGQGANLAHPSRSSRPAGRPWWRPRGNAALLFAIIPLAK